EQRPIAILQPSELVDAEAVTLQADDVEAEELCTIPLREAVRRDVLDDHGPSAEETVVPKPNKLMDSAKTSDRHKVSDRDMSRERRTIRENIIVPDQTVVTDVARCHEEVAAPNLRLHV